MNWVFRRSIAIPITLLSTLKPNVTASAPRLANDGVVSSLSCGVFYRNKIGFEAAVEIVRNYMKRPERDINKLMKYAEALRESSVVRQFAEVLV